MGSIQIGTFSPTSDELRSNDYLNLLVKIKFLSGQTTYTKTEKALMKQWISPHQWHDIKHVYRNHVLAQHSDPDHVVKILDDMLMNNNG